MGREVQVTFDCSDADRLAAFWALALDYVVEPPPSGFSTWPEFLEAKGMPVPPQGSISAVVDPEGRGPRVLFQRVPEGNVSEVRVTSEVNR